jgi:DUF1365 family protein
MEPGIYRGTLRHRRFRPVAHEFEYPVFMALLDIDRLAETMAQSPFSSYNRFNWASFEERDHFGDASLRLRDRLAADALTHGVPLPAGRVMLLTNLRYLGYCFNPISFFYFLDDEGRVPVVLAEVNSTFGEHRNYWLWSGNRTEAGGMQFRCAKSMHVSPFMPMELGYEFALTAPGRTLTAHMETVDGGNRLFDATLTLERRPWTGGELLRTLVAHPAMTAKVTFAIHWQALRLWMKKVPVFTHPDRVSRGEQNV